MLLGLHDGILCLQCHPMNQNPDRLECMLVDILIFTKALLVVNTLTFQTLKNELNWIESDVRIKGEEEHFCSF
jgi:hypothetical protein